MICIRNMIVICSLESFFSPSGHICWRANNAEVWSWGIDKFEVTELSEIADISKDISDEFYLIFSQVYCMESIFLSIFAQKNEKTNSWKSYIKILKHSWWWTIIFWKVIFFLPYNLPQCLELEYKGSWSCALYLEEGCYYWECYWFSHSKDIGNPQGLGCQPWNGCRHGARIVPRVQLWPLSPNSSCCSSQSCSLSNSASSLHGSSLVIYFITCLAGETCATGDANNMHPIVSRGWTVGNWGRACIFIWAYFPSKCWSEWHLWRCSATFGWSLLGR